MSQGLNAVDFVRDIYNGNNFDYEVRRLLEESPVEYALTLRWLDRWVPPKAMVADIGVGGGHYAHFLAQRGCSIHLVDIAERLLHHAHARLRVAGLQASILGSTAASATDLHALPDNSFDAVLLLGPLYHLCRLADRQQVVREAQRILKSGGVLFAAGINRLAYFREMFQSHPKGVAGQEAFCRQHLADGNVDPAHAPPLGFAHLTTVVEFRALFSSAFDEELLVGVESFAGHNQKKLHLLNESERKAWLDLIEATAPTDEGIGAAEHFLYVGRKQG